MADIFDEVDDDLRRAKLESFWNQYGKFVIGGIVAAVLATAAFVYWRDYTERQSAAYGAAYFTAVQQGESALTPEGEADSAAPADRAGAIEAAEALGALAEEAGGGYATLSRFRAAAMLIEADDRARALDVYKALEADEAVDRLYRDLAGLYVVLHGLGVEDRAALEQRLARLDVPDGPWRHSAKELKALIHLRDGETDAAKTALTQITDTPGGPPRLRARAAELLRTLGGS